MTSPSLFFPLPLPLPLHLPFTFPLPLPLHLPLPFISPTAQHFSLVCCLVFHVCHLPACLGIRSESFEPVLCLCIPYKISNKFSGTLFTLSLSLIFQELLHTHYLLKSLYFVQVTFPVVPNCSYWQRNRNWTFQGMPLL